MLESDIKVIKSKNLNLLLKQQIIRQLEEDTEEQSEKTAPVESEETKVSYHSEVSLQETTIKFYKEDELSSKHEDLKIELANIQVDETNAALQRQILDENYDSVESLMDNILQYLDCIILEIKSSFRLRQTINTYIHQDIAIGSRICDSLTKLSETPELEMLEDMKSKLFVSLHRYEHIKQMRQEHDQRKNDYKLALKNFKIILEVMNINENSLRKLRQQFEEILMNYQHARSALNQELPFILVERRKVLADCLTQLGGGWDSHREDLSRLFKELENNLDLN